MPHPPAQSFRSSRRSLHPRHRPNRSRRAWRSTQWSRRSRIGRAGGRRCLRSRRSGCGEARCVSAQGAGKSSAAPTRGTTAEEGAACPADREAGGATAAGSQIARDPAQGNEGDRRVHQAHGQESGRRSAGPVPGVLPGEAQDHARRAAAIVRSAGPESARACCRTPTRRSPARSRRRANPSGPYFPIPRNSRRSSGSDGEQP